MRDGRSDIELFELTSSYDLRFTNTSGTRVLFDRGTCPGGEFDIYAVRVNP